MWISFVHDQDPNHHGIRDFKGMDIPVWPLYTGKLSIESSNNAAPDVEEGFGVNFRFDQTLPSLAALQEDTYRAEAIDWLIKNSVNFLGS